jgi:hypothetical protein
VKPGETVETAIWLNGTETPEQMTMFKTDVASAMLEAATSQNVALTPLRWAEKRLGDDRVPEPPDHIQGPDVRLLVAEADVLEAETESKFLSELEPRDLARLRRVTRETYDRQFPGYKPLTDRQCDTLINDLGPDAALASLETGRMFIQ